MITAHRLIDEQERFFKELRYNKDRFRDFLGTMAAHYRQPIHRQVALFFHAPATGRAYADAALWERLGMKVRKGADGVPVLTEDGAVSYVYDVSELQDKEQAAAHRLLWSEEAEKKVRLREIIHQMEAASGDVVAARDTLSYKKTGEASAAEYDVPVYVR